MKVSAPFKWLLFRWLSRRRYPTGRPYRPVGIYKVDRVGDFVLALGAIRRIVQAEGAKNCLLIISPYVQELAAREFPSVEQVVVQPFLTGLRPLLRYLRSRSGENLFRLGVGKLICLRHHRFFLENIILGFIPAGETWGAVNSELARESGQWLGSISFDHTCRTFPELPGEPSEMSRHRAVVDCFFGYAVEVADVVPCMEAGSADLVRFVGVSPYGSAAVRDFPLDLLASTGRFLWREHHLPLRLLSPREDANRYGELADRLTRAGVPSVEVRVCPTLADLIDAVSECRLVLSVETATAHLATALDRPLIALVGGGHYGWLAPWWRSSRQKWLTHPLSCFQCNWFCIHSEPRCLTHINEVTVQQGISELLTASGE